MNLSLAVILGFLICIVNMAQTGFLVNQVHTTICAPDAAAAIVALGGRFPYVGGSEAGLCNLNSSVHTPPDVFTNNITCHDLTGNQVYTFSHNLVLARCDPDDTLGTHAAAFADGLEMGWGVVAAMAVALSIIFIKRAFFR